MKKLYTLFLLSLLSCTGSDSQSAVAPIIEDEENPKATVRIDKLQIDGEISGDLYLADAKSATVIVLIAGSGPTDRNGNQPPSNINNSLKFLAANLSDLGHNVFTFDKRVIAQLKNQTIDPKATFDDAIADVSLVVQTLKKDFENVVIAGHSEGATLGLLAAKAQGVSAYISLAGPADSIDQIITAQIAQQAPFLREKVEGYFEILRTGSFIENVDPMLVAVFHPANQAYLMSWMKYNPAEEIAQLKVPILIVNGDRDLQVAVEQAEGLKNAQPKASLKIISNMNHIFKAVGNQQDNLSSYNDPNRPIHKELPAEIHAYMQLNSL